MRYLLLSLLTVCLAGCSSSDDKTTVDVPKIPSQEDYLGHWYIVNNHGNYFYITINPDGSAESDWNMGQRGRWTSQEGDLLIQWHDGWRDILFVNDGAFQKRSFEPGQLLDTDPYSISDARRVNTIPPKGAPPTPIP